MRFGPAATTAEARAGDGPMARGWVKGIGLKLMKVEDSDWIRLAKLISNLNTGRSRHEILGVCVSMHIKSISKAYQKHTQNILKESTKNIL